MTRTLLIGTILTGMTMALAGCGGGGGSGSDTTAPVTTAAPQGGAISASQAVVLTANEPAVIFYTTSGTPLGTVLSGVSPVTVTAGQLGAPTYLFFHGVDGAGNVEQTRIESYSIAP